MIVRREVPADVASVRLVQVAAFRTSPDEEPVEARLLDELRLDVGWLPKFSLVAEREGRVVGHAVCTRGYVGDVPALGVGPIGVEPSLQRGGVGLALVHAMIGAADASDEPLIALLGSPKYYGRYGFVPSEDVGIQSPDPSWGVHFQVRTLAAYDASIAGTFSYAAPFDSL